MKKTLIAFALVLFTAATASAAPINFGFETGDTTGWSENLVGGDAEVVSSFGAYLPEEGNYFLKMTTGNTGVNQYVSQFFFMSAGETIYGKAAWVGNDYLPYNDDAAVSILGFGGGVVWSQSIAMAGDYVDTPWQGWSFTSTNNQLYAVAYSVKNVGDSLLDSYGLFDAHVPDGGSALALLGLGMIGLSTLRRKLF